MYAAHKVKQDFNRAAESYDRHANLQKAVLQQVYLLAKTYFPAQAKILDAGCGTGGFGRLASEQKGWDLLQCDIAPAMCLRATPNESKTFSADILQLALAKESVEGAVSSCVLQWVDDVEQALTEMRRILKQKGKLVIATLGPATLQELKVSINAVDSMPHIHQFLARERWDRIIGKSGFSILYSRVEQRVEYYPHIFTLLYDLKMTGAGNKHEDRRRGLTGKNLFAELASWYEKHFSTPRGLPATWQVFYWVLEKIE